MWKGNGQNTSRVSQQSIRPIEFRFTEAIYRMQLSGRGKLVKTSFDDGFFMKIRCPLQCKKVTARARCACLRIDIDRFSTYFPRFDDETCRTRKAERERCPKARCHYSARGSTENLSRFIAESRWTWRARDGNNESELRRHEGKPIQKNGAGPWMAG